MSQVRVFCSSPKGHLCRSGHRDRIVDSIPNCETDRSGFGAAAKLMGQSGTGFNSGLFLHGAASESEPLGTLNPPKISIRERFVKGYDTKKFPTVVRLSLIVPALPRTFRSARSQSSAGEPLRKARASQNSYARAAIFCCLADSERSSIVTVIFIFIAWFVTSTFPL
jgi:hypothetical protein